MIQAYLLYFDTSIMKLRAEVIQISNESSEKLDIELNNYLTSDGYEFVDYSDDITILVDDTGFFKPENPVFRVETVFGDTLKLAGRLLFVRNIYNEYSTDVGSIKYEDIFMLRTQLQIQLVGMTKGE